jgi:hypothetical protein
LPEGLSIESGRSGIKLLLDTTSELRQSNAGHHQNKTTGMLLCSRKLLRMGIFPKAAAKFNFSLHLHNISYMLYITYIIYINFIYTT